MDTLESNHQGLDDVLATHPANSRISGKFLNRQKVLYFVIFILVVAIVATLVVQNRSTNKANSGGPIPGVFSALAQDIELLPFPALPQYPAKIVTSDNYVGDAPNSYIIEVGAKYYMYSSQGNVAQPNISVRTSTNMLDWSSPIDALPTLPTWAKCCFTWSPDVHYIQGRYVMWFSSIVRHLVNPTSADGGIECLGWATSGSPLGPFAPDPSPYSPLCQASRFGSIDPHVFVDPSGALYLIWKSDDNADVTSNTHSIIWVQHLAPNGTTLEGNPHALITADRPWEGRIVEDGQLVYVQGAYWLFYSANWYNQPDYSIALAKCVGPMGPCTKLGVWLNGNLQGQGTGESSIFESNNGRYWITYSPWAARGSSYTPRPVALARLGFLPSGPYLAAP